MSGAGSTGLAGASSGASGAAGLFPTTNVDGVSLKSDWYLCLTNAASEVLRGKSPRSTNIPIQP